MNPKHISPAIVEWQILETREALEHLRAEMVSLNTQYWEKHAQYETALSQYENLLHRE